MFIKKSTSFFLRSFVRGTVYYTLYTHTLNRKGSICPVNKPSAIYYRRYLFGHFSNIRCACYWSSMFAVEDPLDSADFDPVSFINQRFPTEASLDGLDTFVAAVNSQIATLDEEISKSIQTQSVSGKQATQVLCVAFAFIFFLLLQVISPFRISLKLKLPFKSCLIKLPKLSRKLLSPRKWYQKYVLILSGWIVRKHICKVQLHR